MTLNNSLGPNIDGEVDDNDGNVWDDSSVRCFNLEDNLDRSRGISPGLAAAKWKKQDEKSFSFQRDITIVLSGVKKKSKQHSTYKDSIQD